MSLIKQTLPSAGEIIFPFSSGIFLSGSLKNQRIKNVIKKPKKDNNGTVVAKNIEMSSDIAENFQPSL